MMDDFFGDPFHELRRMEKTLNRLASAAAPAAQSEDASKAVATTNASSAACWWPSVDLRETDAGYQIIAELPGVKKEDVSVDLSAEGLLTVKGAKAHEKEEKGERWHAVERSYGSFQRSFRVPRGTDPAKISAEYADGVLRLCVPKPAQAQPMKIDVK
eukprot:TRINITY_DN1427_c0_g2_i1.p2 TRINITY_DN1427_c0_g2~~TRINITY_DN1427_c0_g2_i1.p2  ORF type:complete len:158 (+),score=59.69 TRINITY_DN1427_c0_g2_i1:46-519(+)